MKISKAIILSFYIFSLSVPLSASAHSVDRKKLPLGDGRLSSSPKKTWIWACHTDPQAGGAEGNAPWIDFNSKTYDFTQKAIVDGSVTWPHKFSISLKGDKRVFTSNDYPNHPTGTFPISRSDDAYLFDRNPNSISEQSIRVELPANPQLNTSPSCAPGAVGVLKSGVVLFNALDAPGRDAVAHETQDNCQGHPQESGVYHYHNLSSCIPDKVGADGHSEIMGYAIDGFGIFGHKDVGGKELTSEDLDECHGHTHEIDWDGKRTTLYHYHATWDFPYTIGCLRGSYTQEDVRKISGPRPQRNRGQGNRVQYDRPERGRRGREGHPDLNVVAQKLGVSTEELREALGPPPPDLERAAEKLGIPLSKLREALPPPR
ncbi:MAG: YHYH protein [Bdellovibrionota bacterium]